MEKKASSVDWFYQQIRDNGAGFTHEDLMEWYRQAKAMHKQEHEDAYIEGSKCKYDGWAWTLEGMKEMANEHYNETFSNETE